MEKQTDDVILRFNAYQYINMKIFFIHINL